MRRAMRLWTLACACGLSLLAAPFSVLAQPSPPDEVVHKLVKLALENMPRALCADLKPCPPATPEEFKSPPVSMEHARAIIASGTRTALADWCGLDWRRRSYLPMMHHYRRTLRFNERQMSLVGLLHGIHQGMTEGALKTKGTCDEATRAKLDAQLPKT